MTIKAEKYFNKGTKNKKKSKFIDEEFVTLNDIKRDRHQKQFRNYDNALRAKNLDRLLSYEDD
jgi:hypothetical protein